MEVQMRAKPMKAVPKPLKSCTGFKSEHNEWYPHIIFRAITQRNESLVQFLAKRMKRGVFYKNKSPIDYAFEWFPECVHHLIGSGLQIHFENNQTGEYPIHVAIRMKRYDWIQMLCQKGCNPNVKNRSGDRPLHLVVTNGCSVAIALLLISCGANPNLKNNLGLTPISCAINSEDEEMLRMLIRMGYRLSTGLEELKRAIKSKKFKSVLILLENIKTIDNSIEFDSDPILWFFARCVVGEQNTDDRLLTTILQKLMEMTSGVNTIHNIWGTLMHFFIYADICCPTECFKPLFRQLIRFPKCDINLEFIPKDTKLRDGTEVPVECIMANGTPLSFALEIDETNFYAEELIRVGADYRTINWYHIFFAPNKVKALKFLILTGGHIPDTFRVDSNPIFDETLTEGKVNHFCEEFDKFVNWWDRSRESPLSLKLSSRKAIRNAISLKDRRKLTERDFPVFGNDFNPYPMPLFHYILYDSYEDFEEI